MSGGTTIGAPKPAPRRVRTPAKRGTKHRSFSYPQIATQRWRAAPSGHDSNTLGGRLDEAPAGVAAAGRASMASPANSSLACRSTTDLIIVAAIFYCRPSGVALHRPSQPPVRPAPPQDPRRRAPCVPRACVVYAVAWRFVTVCALIRHCGPSGCSRWQARAKNHLLALGLRFSRTTRSVIGDAIGTNFPQQRGPAHYA